MCACWHTVFKQYIVGADDHIGPAMCTGNWNAPMRIRMRLVGADASVRPRYNAANRNAFRRIRTIFRMRRRGGVLPLPKGKNGFADGFRENGMRPAVGRCGHRPLQTCCVVATGRANLFLRSAGGQRRPPLQGVVRGRRSLCQFAIVSCAGGVEPRPYGAIGGAVCGPMWSSAPTDVVRSRGGYFSALLCHPARFLRAFF